MIIMSLFIENAELNKTVNMNNVAYMYDDIKYTQV